jgi:hypothetical protein
MHGSNLTSVRGECLSDGAEKHQPLSGLMFLLQLCTNSRKSIQHDINLL